MSQGWRRTLTQELVRQIWESAHPYTTARQLKIHQGSVTHIIARRTYRDFTDGWPDPQVKVPLPGVVPFGRGRRVGHEIDSETGCWNWRGKCNIGGYGVLRIGRLVPAHRAYYERIHGPVPVGLELDHLCRNTSCVNPEHLEPVTRRENIRRGLRTKLTATHVCQIRKRYALGDESTTDLAREYGVTHGHVADMVQRKSWRVL